MVDKSPCRYDTAVTMSSQKSLRNANTNSRHSSSGILPVKNDSSLWAWHSTEVPTAVF